MSSASTSSGPTSARTSPAKPGESSPLPGEAAAAVGSPGSDAFLREQADQAKRAVGKAFTDFKAAVAGTADPRVLPRKFPFVTVALAAVAGFVAAVLAIPSKEQQELKRLEKIRRAMYPEPKVPEQAKETVDKAKAEAAKPPLWATLLKEGITAARPILVSLVTAQMSAKKQQQDNPPPPDDSATAG